MMCLHPPEPANTVQDAPAFAVIMYAKSDVPGPAPNYKPALQKPGLVGLLSRLRKAQSSGS